MCSLLLLAAGAGAQDNEHRGGLRVHRLPPEALPDHAHRHQRQAGGQRVRFGQGGWGVVGWCRGRVCLQTVAKNASVASILPGNGLFIQTALCR